MTDDVMFERRPGAWRGRMIFGLLAAAVTLWFAPKFALLAWRAFTDPGQGGAAMIALGALMLTFAAAFSLLGVFALKAAWRAWGRRHGDRPLLRLSAAGVTLWLEAREEELLVSWSSIHSVSITPSKYQDILVLHGPDGRALTRSRMWPTDRMPAGLGDRTVPSADIMAAIRAYPAYRGN